MRNRLTVSYNCTCMCTERCLLKIIHFVLFLSVNIAGPHGGARSSKLQHPGSTCWECGGWRACSTNQRTRWISRSAGNSGKHHDVPHATELHCCSYYYDGKCLHSCCLDWHAGVFSYIYVVIYNMRIFVHVWKLSDCFSFCEYMCTHIAIIVAPFEGGCYKRIAQIELIPFSNPPLSNKKHLWLEILESSAVVIYFITPTCSWREKQPVTMEWISTLYACEQAHLLSY